MSCHGPQATANSQTHACSHFTTTRWHGVLHTKRSDFGGQRSFAFATFRLVLFTTFFTAPMGRCKIQRGAFTLPVSHWYTPQDVPTPPHRRRGGRAQLTRAGVSPCVAKRLSHRTVAGAVVQHKHVFVPRRPSNLSPRGIVLQLRRGIRRLLDIRSEEQSTPFQRAKGASSCCALGGVRHCPRMAVCGQGSS